MTWHGTTVHQSDEGKANHWRRCEDSAKTTGGRNALYKEQQYRLLVSLFDAVRESRMRTLNLARELLSGHDLVLEDSEQFRNYVEGAEQRLAEITVSTQWIKSLGTNKEIPADTSDPHFLHMEWLKEVENQTTILRKIANYEHLDDAVAQGNRYIRINLDAVINAIATLKQWETGPGEVCPLGVKETVVVFLIDLATENGHLEDREVARLNLLFEQELSHAEYLSRYGDKLKDDQAIKELVKLIVELRNINKELAVFIANHVDMLIDGIVGADEVYDEHEWRRISRYRELLGKALGVEMAPLEKPEPTPA